jgi:hypothetical protein
MKRAVHNCARSSRSENGVFSGSASFFQENSNGDDTKRIPKCTYIQGSYYDSERRAKHLSRVLQEPY